MNPAARGLKGVQETVGAPLAKVRGQWRKVVTGSDRIRVRDHVKSYEHKPSYIKFFDKLSFTLGVLNICATEYFVIHEPSKYWIWYSIVLPVMLLGRWSHFKSNKMHYFLLDFCYTVILLSLVHIHFLYRESYSEILFKMAFILSTGPLPAAIPLWKNSLVFHDFDKITSVYIHFLPTCLYYCLRVSKEVDSVIHYNELGIRDYVNCMLFYVTWQIFYLFKTEVSDKDKLDSDPALLTSLKWLSSNQKNKLSKSVLGFCRKVRLLGPDESFSSTSMKTKMVFVTTQMLFTVIAMIPTYHLWMHPTLHLIYIGLIFSISVFYGASYYVEVFSKRYTLALEKAAEKAIARQRTSRSNSNASLSQSFSNGNVMQGGNEINGFIGSGSNGGAPEMKSSLPGPNEDITGVESYDDYDAEFSLDNLFDAEDIDYILMIDE